ncbi:hypothetical protein CANMA_003305 [Candida margitis]|uniref:uncharacterized protein n=1 Tax=Candida margitis TaxID=1775924 RepID=UPI0022269510|nr:uncharacterized protein CANMA_003305 [Candida margitis]KAI5966059.1 hypothetical protein CANMA_003305 [Candida margitis]
MRAQSANGLNQKEQSGSTCQPLDISSTRFSTPDLTITDSPNESDTSFDLEVSDFVDDTEDVDGSVEIAPKMHDEPEVES